MGGKPILEHCLDALKSSGLNEVVIVTHYMGDAIRKHFGDGEKMGLKMEYVKQKAVLGTGNALSVAEPHLDGDFVLVYGDLLFTPDVIKKVLDLYKQEKPSAVMAVVPVENPESYGIIDLEKAKHVKRIVEKPSAARRLQTWRTREYTCFPRGFSIS